MSLPMVTSIPLPELSVAMVLMSILRESYVLGSASCILLRRMLLVLVLYMEDVCPYLCYLIQGETIHTERDSQRLRY